MRLGSPLEYSLHFYLPQFTLGTLVNFLIIFSAFFLIFKLNPNMHFLRKIISIKYIAGAIALAFLAFISFIIFDSITRPQINEGIPPPVPLNMLPEDIVPIRVDGNELKNVIPPDLPNPNSEEMRLYRQNEWDKRISETLGNSVVQVKGSGILEMPFTIGEEEEIISDVQVSYLGKWDSSSSFSFIEYDENKCDLFTCYGNSYQYNILSKKYIQSPNDDNDWIISPNGKIALSYEQGNAKEPTESLGVLYMKDMRSGEIRNLGKSVRGTGHDGSYTGSCLWVFAWSPDSKNIAMLDWCNYDAEVGGPAVEILSADAKDISERRFFGYTRYREIGRPKGERLLFWSSDSTKLYAKDSDVVFDAVSGKELFRPKADFAWFVSWFSDSKKILAFAYDLGFAVVDIASGGNIEGYVFSSDIFDSAGLRADMIALTPDGAFVLVAYTKGVYLIDIKTREFRSVDTMKPGEYSFLKWSPDGRRLLYQKDGKIMLREITWK